MRSRHADEFNHDDQADRYDVVVTRETEPIRDGYAATLAWIADRAQVRETDDVADLGSGTGNLTLLLPACRRLVCVDVSERMHDVAREKLLHRTDVEIVTADLLEFVHEHPAEFDVLVSAYAIHHLEDDEKDALFRAVWHALRPGGRAVFGDLMFADAADRRRVLAEYAAQGRPDITEAASEEFYWDLEATLRTLESLGFDVETKRFSPMSWAVSAVKPAE